MLYDIGIGILISIVSSYVFHIPLTFLLILIVVLLSLLPDIDVLLNLITGNKHVASQNRDGDIFGHRMITHYPLLYLIVTFFLYILFSFQAAAIFFAAVFLHLLHDSTGIGWGIKWLWPYSQKFYKFFTDENNHSSSNFVASWTQQEIKEKAGPASNTWIREIYLKPSRVNIIETSVFIGSLVCLYFFLR